MIILIFSASKKSQKAWREEIFQRQDCLNRGKEAILAEVLTWIELILPLRINGVSHVTFSFMFRAFLTEYPCSGKFMIIPGMLI